MGIYIVNEWHILCAMYVCSSLLGSVCNMVTFIGINRCNKIPFNVKCIGCGISLCEFFRFIPLVIYFVYYDIRKIIWLMNCFSVLTLMLATSLKKLQLLSKQTPFWYIRTITRRKVKVVVAVTTTVIVSICCAIQVLLVHFQMILEVGNFNKAILMCLFVYSLSVV